jgi:hypothetical protein
MTIAARLGSESVDSLIKSRELPSQRDSSLAGIRSLFASTRDGQDPAVRDRQLEHYHYGVLYPLLRGPYMTATERLSGRRYRGRDSLTTELGAGNVAVNTTAMPRPLQGSMKPTTWFQDVIDHPRHR